MVQRGGRPYGRRKLYAKRVFSHGGSDESNGGQDIRVFIDNSNVDDQPGTFGSNSGNAIFDNDTGTFGSDIFGSDNDAVHRLPVKWLEDENLLLRADGNDFMPKFHVDLRGCKIECSFASGSRYNIIDEPTFDRLVPQPMIVTNNWQLAGYNAM